MNFSSLIRTFDTRYAVIVTLDEEVYLDVSLKEGEVVIDDLYGPEDGFDRGCVVTVTHFMRDGFIYRFIEEYYVTKYRTLENTRVSRWLVDDVDDILNTRNALPVVCPDLIRDINDKINDALDSQEAAARLAA